MDIASTDKQRIEQQYHDNWAKSIDVGSLLVREAFEAVTAAENRYAFERLSPVQGKTMLDLGCGAGETSVYFALQGAQVTATDISEEMLAVARKLAAQHGVALRTLAAAAEALPFPDGSFDLVFGNGVLHHVELVPALKEIRRVLKPGGRAAFVDPLKHNPLIHIYRWLASDNRTPTEKPLGFDDFARIKTVFPRWSHREFWLTTLWIFLHMLLVERLHPGRVRYWKKIIEDARRYSALYRRFRRIDDWILSRAPWLGRYCWNMVLVVEKEK